MDARLIDRADAIPGAINVALGTPYIENVFLKSPQELLWTLKACGSGIV